MREKMPSSLRKTRQRPQKQRSGGPAMAEVNPYLFVVGCPRSGTTLLQRMLDHHPDLAVANDTHFIPRSLEKASRDLIPIVLSGQDPPLSPQLLEAVRAYHRFSRLALPADAVERAAQANTYAEFVSKLYDEYARLRNKRLAGEKTPDYVRRIPLLHSLFPHSRFIHIVRDGRDVALSLLEWAHEKKGPGRFELWREQPVAVCALWWRWQVRAGLRNARELPEGLAMQVGYEELVARPDVVLQKLAAFLDIAESANMLHYHEGKTRSEPGLSAKRAWLPPTAGIRNWQTEMAAEDVELFEALAGDLLVELGYEQAVDSVSPQIARLAGYYLDWWEANIVQRKTPP